jgi:hypothetical protein
MQKSIPDLRESFWALPPELPDGLRLERREPIVVTRPGRGGASVFELIDLSAPSLELIAAYQSRLLAGQVSKLKRQLETVGSQRIERQRAEGRTTPAALHPAIITDAAKPSVIEACQRESVAILDSRGTCIVSAGGVFVYVKGKRPIERRWKGSLFSGKASRIVRFLLTKAAFEPALKHRSVQAFATECDLSHAYSHGVLNKLEREGFVDRTTARGGFHVKDPLGLLRAWVESGERTAAAVEGFYAPDTTAERLAKAAKLVEEAEDISIVFSLASALEPDQVHVAGLPHGAYWPGDLAAIVEALNLKRTTPHNFLVLRPDPLVWTEAGGVLMSDPEQVATLPVYPRVALPQVIADFATLSGRGRQQADFLVGVYAKRLPYRVEEV